ncbi:ParA family protein [Eubacteriales bacterium OttesenSCG-928-M02]|nr:ParA family protein [Eubacteriales bacterium OttesenSCG-928-M02]
MKNGKITIFCGNFGSGKTELAMAYGVERAKDMPVTLVDMDLVNPYFTTSLQRERMEKLGVEVLAPSYATSGVDAPSIPREVLAVFDKPERHIVIDLGGDPVGAIAMGSLSSRIADFSLVDGYFVLNAARPRTRTAVDAKQLLEEIQALSKVPVTGIINNTNLGGQTDGETLLMGNDVAKELAALSGLPIRYYGVTAGWAEEARTLGLVGEPILVHRWNKPEWAE